MKNIKYLTLILSVAFVLQSCNQDLPENEAIFIESVGGVVNNATPTIAYVVGNDGTYTASGSVYQGTVSVPSIDVFVSFRSSVDGAVSNEALLTTLTPAQESFKTVPFEYSFKYEDLIAGLTIDGTPLPASDSGLNIGDSFTLTYRPSLSTGQTVQSAAASTVSVGTRFAGTYNIIDQLYYRIGVNRDDVGWPDQFTILSIDATTYQIVDYFGPFDGNIWYFQIDENDVISYPPETPSGDAQTGNGQPLTTCQLNPGDLTNVPCDPSLTNYVVRDDVNGADILYMTYGYLTAGSGPREFYQVLQKVVD